MKRLEAGLNALDICRELRLDNLIMAIRKLIKDKNILNNNIKISYFSIKEEDSFFIYSISSSYPCQNKYKQGVATILFDAERNKPNIKIGHTKVRESANAKIKSQNIFETLLVNHNNEITEGSRSNVFFIKDSQIIPF